MAGFMGIGRFDSGALAEPRDDFQGAGETNRVSCKLNRRRIGKNSRWRETAL